jgi:hypothetical protein
VRHRCHDERAQEGEPADAVVAGGYIDAQVLAVPVGVDADRDQRVGR